MEKSQMNETVYGGNSSPLMIVNLVLSLTSEEWK